jgi:very-short-patch-repair endonuclease
LHGDYYDYSKVEYVNADTKVQIICPKHGLFEQKPYKHLQGQGCRKCVNKVSKAEQEIFEFILKYRKDAQQSNRKIIKPYELDIYIPSLKVALEYNGTYWHSEKFREPNHREVKTSLCCEQGIQLLHIEEEDWNNDKNSILNKIKWEIT